MGTTKNIVVNGVQAPTTNKVADWKKAFHKLATKNSIENPEVDMPAAPATDEFARFNCPITFHAVAGDKYDGSPRFTKSGRQILAFIDMVLHMPFGDITVSDGKLLGALGDKKPCVMLAGRQYEATQDVKFGKNKGVKKGEKVNVDIVGAEWDTKNQIKVLLKNAMNGGFSLARTRREDDPEVAEADDFFASMSKTQQATTTTSTGNKGTKAPSALDEAKALANG